MKRGSGTGTCGLQTAAAHLSFTFNRAARTIYELHKVVGFSATATLDRDDFGITANPDSIGQNVSVWLELEAVRDDHAITTPKEHP